MSEVAAVGIRAALAIGAIGPLRSVAVDRLACPLPRPHRSRFAHRRDRVEVSKSRSLIELFLNLPTRSCGRPVRAFIVMIGNER